MFEIDFKNVDDGIHWTNVGDEIMMMESFVPTVELHQVPSRVKQGDAVWAKCRVGRLGKFAVTSEGVSMNFELHAAKKLLSKGRERSSVSVHAQVESGVVESLLDRSSSDLARMVADKKMAEFHEAIRQLRDTLENLGQIECRFQGMQGDSVVVREILSA
ncbi:hypothetical protein DFQ26_004226 [Actinomortierella ambigua]|nr:hypothetical protein DFQ26_004226 [Actinomortierella ambigua]